MLTHFQGDEIWCHGSYVDDVKSEKWEDSTGKEREQPYHGGWGSGGHISTSVQWNSSLERSPTNAKCWQSLSNNPACTREETRGRKTIYLSWMWEKISNSSQQIQHLRTHTGEKPLLHNKHGKSYSDTSILFPTRELTQVRTLTSVLPPMGRKSVAALA